MLNGIRIFLATACIAVVSCQSDMKLDYAQGEGIEKDKVMPDVPEGEKQGFALTTEDNSLRSVIGTGTHEFSPSDKIYLRSEYYSPTVNGDGSVHLDVLQSESGNYHLFCFPKGSKYWYRSSGDNPLNELVIPYSQFYRSTVDSLAYYPLYSHYERNGSGNVIFKEVISAIGITLKGNAKIASVHLQNKAATGDISDLMAGVASFDPAAGFVLGEGVDFVNLNCTDGGRGVSISQDGKTFYLVLAPGNYQSGMTLTVTGMDHKGQCFDVPAIELAAGEVKTFTYTYAPDENLLFFEHFDNFVWGGNVKGNPVVSSYAPDALSSPSAGRKGTEEAFTTVGTTTPGSAFIQANWSTVNGWTVRERPAVDAEYVKSRNIGDYTYLFRCQEYQGCVSVGAGDENRGGVQPMKTIPVDDVYYGVKLDFDICLRYGTEDFFCTQLDGSGIASSLTVDGQAIALENTLEGNNTYSYTFQNICSIRRSDIPGPGSERYSEGWHHVEMTFDNLNELSALGLWGGSSSNVIKHGAFIDNIEIRYQPAVHPENRLRVLLFNIQNGMWADQGNNFSNFVSFVNRYDPDVCIFCEAQSLWKTGEATEASSKDFQLFTSRSGRGSTAVPFENPQWRALAERFGHSYHAVGAYKDDYPQVITSRYPITTVKRISSSLTHGAGHFQVTIGGQTVNFVSLHLWPFKYAKSVWDKDEKTKEASAAKLEGYDDDVREVESILNATLSRTDCGDNWLIMGDTNTVSPIDGDYYDSIAYSRWDSEGYKWVLAHQAFRNYVPQLFDMLREGAGSLYTGAGRFMPSTSAQARIDIMYGTESMRRRVSAMSLIVQDKWSTITTSAVYDPESESKHAKMPSDHRPLLVEFDMSK